MLHGSSFIFDSLQFGEKALLSRMSHRSSLERYDRRGLSITAIGGLLFTLDIPLLRLAAGDQWTMIFARGVLMALTITLAWLAYRWMRGNSQPFINGRAGLIVAATNTLANIMFISAVTKTTAANLVFILALNPVFCMLLGALWLRERLPLAVWGSVALSMAGVAIIGWDGVSTGTYVGDLLALGVALCTATGLTVVRRTGSNVIPSLAIGSCVSAAIGFLLIGGNIAQLSTESWGWIALNGMLVVPLASALIALGPRYIPAAEVAMFFLLDTVFTPLWIWLIFGEVPSQRAVLGGLTIILSLFFLGLWRIKSSRPHAERGTVPVHPV
jgi:drug/metabolite transporter (DMT)-like permease